MATSCVADAVFGRCAVVATRTLRMGGALCFGAGILSGINASVWRHHPNFNYLWDTPSPVRWFVKAFAMYTKALAEAKRAPGGDGLSRGCA